MHATYLYHCEGPHKLYYNHRHALLLLSLSLSIIKNVPQNQQPDTAYDFSNFQKTGIYVKSLFIKKLHTKFHQNRTRNKEVMAILVMGWKSRNFRKFLLPGPPILDFFRFFIVNLKVHDEKNRMALSHRNQPVSSRDLTGAESTPPPVNVLQKAHQ